MDNIAQFSTQLSLLQLILFCSTTSFRIHFSLWTEVWLYLLDWFGLYGVGVGGVVRYVAFIVTLPLFVVFSSFSSLYVYFIRQYSKQSRKWMSIHVWMFISTHFSFALSNTFPLLIYHALVCFLFSLSRVLLEFVWHAWEDTYHY